jgi:hypothetical protein
MPARALAARIVALVLALLPPGPALHAQGTPGAIESPVATKPPEAQAQRSEWFTVTGPEGVFTAELPAAPKYTASRVTTASGSLYMLHQYLLEQGDTAFIVQTATYPDDINVANPRVNLQGGLDTLAKSMEGEKWASIDWVRHQGLTASDAVGLRSGVAIRSFSVMKGRQVFTLIYAGTRGSAKSADVNRFIASLRVPQ